MDGYAEAIVETAEDKGIPVERARLIVDTKKWLMSKLAAKKYGDRQQLEHTGPGGGPIRTESAVERLLARLRDPDVQEDGGEAGKQAAGEES